MNLRFDYTHARAKKARLRGILTTTARVALSALCVLFLVGGITLIAFDSPLGWLLAGFAFVPAMFLEWYNGELSELSPSVKPNELSDVLEAEVL